MIFINVLLSLGNKKTDMDMYEFTNTFDFNYHKIYWTPGKQELYLSKTKKIIKVPFTISNIQSNVKLSPNSTWKDQSIHQDNVLVLGPSSIIDGISVYYKGCLMKEDGVYGIFSDIVIKKNHDHDWCAVRHEKGIFILDNMCHKHDLKTNLVVDKKHFSVDKSNNFMITLSYSIDAGKTFITEKFIQDKGLVMEYSDPKNVKRVVNKYIIQVNNGWECSICMDSDDKRIFVPCGHCACVECCKSIKACPFCKKPVEISIKMFD